MAVTRVGRARLPASSRAKRLHAAFPPLDNFSVISSGDLIDVAKSLVEVAGGFELCWGELDCYSCCATLPRSLIARLLNL